MPLRPQWKPRVSRPLTGANPRPRDDEPTVEAKPMEPRPAPKQMPKRSESFLDFVRSHPCHNCGKPAPSEAAHFAPKGDGGGMGTKADDRRTVPQCQRCHNAYHKHGTLPWCDLSGGVVGSWSREDTERAILREQVRLLIEWDDLRDEERKGKR